jgi:hypothetical protein
VTPPHRRRGGRGQRPRHSCERDTLRARGTPARRPRHQNDIQHCASSDAAVVLSSGASRREKKNKKTTPPKRMADRGRKAMPVGNRLCHARDQLRSQRLHRDKVTNMKAHLDNSCPETLVGLALVTTLSVTSSQNTLTLATASMVHGRDAHTPPSYASRPLFMTPCDQPDTPGVSANPSCWG